jgi:predicted permease
MSDIMHDIRAAINNIRQRPFYAVLAVGTLALGLTASIAVFTYVNAYYQPFPGVDADGLVQVFGMNDDNPYLNLSSLDYQDYAAGATGAFEGLAAAQSRFAASVRHETMTEVVFGQAVSGNYFAVLDIALSAGRGIAVDDDQPDAPPVAVISHDWWQRQFNGDASVIGSTVYLNYKPFTVVGVTAPTFLGSTSSLRPDVWIPTEPFKVTYTNWAALSQNRDVPLVRVYGRLRDGVSAERGLAELEGLAAGLDEAYPGADGPRRVRVQAATWIDPRSRLAEADTTHVMMGAAGGLLLLVCANVANLLLAIASGRRREMAVRSALGASPGRLVRQLLTENVMLSALAGGVALLAANPATARLGSYFARPSVWGSNVPREAAVGLGVVAFAVAISVLTGFVAGLLPALRVSRRNLVDTLKSDADVAVDGPGGIWGWRVLRVPDMLVSAQVALSVMLLVVAGLVLRTLASASSVDPGFSYDRVLASYASTSSTAVEVADRERFFRELAERLTEEPWVQAATVADNAPLSPQASTALRLEGLSEPVRLVYSRVIPGFFESLGMEIIRGRSFSPTDTVDTRGVAIVNEALVRRYFEGEDPLGRAIWWPGSDGAEERRFEIVGVVRDARAQSFLAQPQPMVYFSFPQHYYPPGNAVLVATTIDPEAAVPLLTQQLRAFEPHIAIVNVLPYRQVVSGFLYTQRMNAEMFSIIAVAGLVLAAVGLFSVMTLAVSRRTREIGIRMAIGARRGDIARLVGVRVLSVVVVGMGLGSLGMLGVARVIGSMLYGVGATDPVALVGAAGVLIAAALLAAYLPMRRAVDVDPMRSLRTE